MLARLSFFHVTRSITVLRPSIQHCPYYWKWSASIFPFTLQSVRGKQFSSFFDWNLIWNLIKPAKIRIQRLSPVLSSQRKEQKLLPIYFSINWLIVDGFLACSSSLHRGIGANSGKWVRFFLYFPLLCNSFSLNDPPGLHALSFYRT